MNSPIAPIGIARRMILAIVTSREIYPGNFKWYSVISSYGYFFYMPRFITFAEPALSLSSVKEPYCCFKASE